MLSLLLSFRPAVHACLRAFRRDRSGATAIEYALICALIGGVLFVAAGEIGGKVDFRYNQVESAFATVD